MFDVEFIDGQYEYTDSSGYKRRYPSYDDLDKPCFKCGVKLGEQNLVLGNLKKNCYICRTCDTNRLRIRRHKRMVNKKQDKRKYETEIKTGYVYVFGVDAYPNHVKIGMSIDVEKRKESANTWTPFRDFIYHGKVFSSDKRKLESKVHHKLKDHVATSREWFSVTPQVALKTLRECENSND